MADSEKGRETAEFDNRTPSMREPSHMEEDEEGRGGSFLFHRLTFHSLMQEPAAALFWSDLGLYRHCQCLRQLHCIVWVKCRCSVKQNCCTASKEDLPESVTTKQEVTLAQPEGEI